MFSEENNGKLSQSNKKKKTTSINTHVAPKHCNKKNSKTKNPKPNQNTTPNCLLFIPPGNSVTPNITPALNQSLYLITNPVPGTTAKPQRINVGKLLEQEYKTAHLKFILTHLLQTWLVGSSQFYVI